MVALGAIIDGKPSIAIGINDALQKSSGMDANALVKKEVATIIKGGGGGQKSLADADALMSAITAVKNALHA